MVQASLKLLIVIGHQNRKVIRSKLTFEIEIEIEIEIEKLVNVNIVPVTVKDTQPLFDISKYYSWKKLIRVMAYALKFISKLKDSKDRKGNKKRMFDEADIFCNTRN